MPRKKPRKKKKSKKNKEKRVKIKPAVCVLVDSDGSTVRFERWAGELFFYIDGELTQRYVQILQVQKKKGWIIIRGLKLKNEQIFSSEVKTVVEMRPEDKVRVLEEIERIRYWHGPFCPNSVAFSESDLLILKKYDARKGCWQCISSAKQQHLEAKEMEINLSFTVLPHNCKIRQDTDMYGFIETENMGIGLIAKQDIQQKKILMKDRAILFANWHRGLPLHHACVGDLFHSLITNHPNVWTYIMENLAHDEEEVVLQFQESSRKVCLALQEQQPMYKDEAFQQKCAVMLSVLFSNAFEFSFPNHDFLCCIFPNLSFFNHSCDPNCMLEYAQNQTGFYGSVRTLRPIKSGEPLTISYFGKHALDPLVERRKDFIRQKRDFDCLCDRCVTETLDSGIPI